MQAKKKRKAIERPWVKLPRKPASEKRTEHLHARVTAAELAAIQRNAAAADKSLVDFIVARCCR